MNRHSLSFVAACIVAAVFVSQATEAADNAIGPASRVPTFMLTGMEISFPLPAGFCIPTGRYAEHARRTADGDAVNITNFSFDDCEAMKSNGDLTRWGIVKTPRSMAAQDAGTREGLIATLKAQFASGEFERSMNQGAAQQSAIATHVAPLGTDAYGGYVGGTMAMNGRTFAAAWSMTVVKHRILALYIYAPYTSPKDVQNVLTLVRTATANMVRANEVR